MKKKISLLLLIFVLVLSFTGCSGKKENVQYDKAALEQYTEMMLQSFSQMAEEDFANFKNGSDMQIDYMLMNTGIPIESKSFIGMIEAWEAGIKECGNYVEHGKYTVEESANEVVITTEAVFEDRKAEISIAFDEKSRMDTMTVAAEYSTGEILKKAGLNTILGMGTVFVVLIFISFIISLFKYIPALEEKFKNKRTAEVSVFAETNAAAPAFVEEETEDMELVAVIAAAIAAAEGTSTDGFVVRSIKRRKANNWN